MVGSDVTCCLWTFISYVASNQKVHKPLFDFFSVFKFRFFFHHMYRENSTLRKSFFLRNGVIVTSWCTQTWWRVQGGIWLSDTSRWECMLNIWILLICIVCICIKLFRVWNTQTFLVRKKLFCWSNLGLVRWKCYYLNSCHRHLSLNKVGGLPQYWLDQGAVEALWALWRTPMAEVSMCNACWLDTFQRVHNQLFTVLIPDYLYMIYSVKCTNSLAY